MRLKRLEFSHDRLYYTLLFLVVFSYTAQFSQVLRPFYQQVSGIINAVCLFILVCMIVKARIRKSQFIAVCITGLIGAYIYLALGRTLFLYCSLILIFAKDKDIEKIYRVFIRTIGSVFAFNVLCTIYFVLFDRGDLYLRVTLNNARPQLDLSCGGHPNHAAAYFVVLANLILYKNWEELKLRHWMLVILLTAIIYYCIGSEAVFFVPLLFLAWVFRNRQAVNNALRFFVKHGVLVFLLFSVIELWAPRIPALSSFVNWLNDISSGRFMLSQKALSYYSVTFFGSKAEFGHLLGSFGEDLYIYADNAYVYMLLREGAVFLCLLQYVLYKSADYLGYRERSLLLAFLMYGIAESNMLSYMTMFPLITAIWYYYKRRKNFE